MLRTLGVILVIYVFGCAQGEVQQGMYRIQNREHQLHVTTEGANTEFARVVGENWLNFGEQRWKVEKFGSDSYSLQPQKYSNNNPLSYHKEPGRRYALPESWKFIKVRDDYYLIQSERTGSCLISNGRRKEILEGKCDQYLPDRQWKFVAL